MKKLFAFVLAIVMVLSMALNAFALEGAHAEWKRLLPVLSGDSGIAVFYSMKDVQDLSEDDQKLMEAAAAELDDARPPHLALKYFCLVEIIGAENPTDIVLEWIEHDEIAFKQYVGGAWVLLEHSVNEDKTIVVKDVTNGPLAIFTNDVYGMARAEVETSSGKRPSVQGKKQNLLPDVSKESTLLVLLHSTEMVPHLSEEIQAQMAEAKAKLKDACPDGCAVKFFCYVEILGEADSVSVVFEELDFNEIHFGQYVNGEWVELAYEINEDGTITVNNVVNGPKAIFVK